VRGEILQWKRTINTHVTKLKPLRRRGDAGGARGVGTEAARRVQAKTCRASPGGHWKDLTDSVNSDGGN